MKYLCINTAGKSTEIAVISGDKRLVWSDSDFRRASVILLPQIEKMLCQLNLELSELDFIACVIGPGSFTGIRIGVSTVRAFCYALNIRAVAVNYLQLLAYNESAECFKNIVSVIDGSNGTAYVSAFDSNYNVISGQEVILQEGLDGYIKRFEPCVVCADEGMAALRADFLPPSNNCRELIKASLAKAENCEFTDYENIQPIYIRVSQAEQDLANKNKGSVIENA